MDRSRWPELKATFTEVFAGRTRDEWIAAFAGLDACVTPVLEFTEVPEHPHVAARATVVDHDGVTQAAPAPRFSRTQPVLPDLDLRLTEPEEILADWSTGERPT